MEVHTVKGDGTAGGLDEPQDAPSGGGLAAAGLTHQAEGLLFMDLEGHVLHRVDIAHRLADDAALDGEIGLEVLHIQQHRGFAHTAASFSASPAWSQQRHRCPGATSVRAGGFSLQMPMQWSQRSANRQPVPKLPAVGTVPRMV